MSAVDLSIVIVSYNTRALLERCLASLAEGAGPLALQAVVVDNGSSDGSLDMVRDRFPAVEVVANAGNPGFAQATNRGIERAHGRIVVWLNSDCETPPGSLAALAAYLDAHPRVGAVGPRLVHPDGRIQPSGQAFPGPSRMVAHFLGLRVLAQAAWLAPLWRRLRPLAGPTARAYLEAHDPGTAPRVVDWVSGACLATPAATAKRVGPLDEGYFMYCEDTDWCHRVHAAGQEVHVVPTVSVVHHVGGSGVTNPFVTFHHHRSLLRYFRRWRPRGFGALRAFLFVAYGLRGLAAEVARVERGRHPWWRLAGLCWTGRIEEARP